MNMPLLTVVLVFTVGAIYVLFPLALDAFLQFRKPRTVTCPESNNAASVRFDAGRAAATAVLGATELRMVGCSRWPERRNCEQKCARQVAR